MLRGSCSLPPEERSSQDSYSARPVARSCASVPSTGGSVLPRGGSLVKPTREPCEMEASCCQDPGPGDELGYHQWGTAPAGHTTALPPAPKATARSLHAGCLCSSSALCTHWDGRSRSCCSLHHACGCIVGPGRKKWALVYDPYSIPLAEVRFSTPAGSSSCGRALQGTSTRAAKQQGQPGQEGSMAEVRGPSLHLRSHSLALAMFVLLFFPLGSSISCHARARPSYCKHDRDEQQHPARRAGMLKGGAKTSDTKHWGGGQLV